MQKSPSGPLPSIFPAPPPHTPAILDDWSHISCNCGIPSCEKPVTYCPNMSYLFPMQAVCKGTGQPSLFSLTTAITLFSLELATSSTGRQHTLLEITHAGRQMMCLGGKGRSKKSHLAKKIL